MLKRSRALLWLIGTLLGLWTAWATLVLPRLEPTQGLEYHLRSFGVRLVLWVLPCAVFLWTQYGRNSLRPLQLGLPPTWRHWAWSLGVTAAATLAISLNVARELGLTPGSVWERLIRNYSFEFPSTPLFEELVFRGVVLAGLLDITLTSVLLEQGASGFPTPLSRWRAAWGANVLATLVFVGAHWPYWIYTEGLEKLAVKSLPVLLLSLVLGMLFARGRSLWPCVLLHWANNELSALVPN
jgi:membrane protease YdiL (CAAX protease family)